MQNALVMAKAARLKAAREKAGFPSASDAARHLGVPYGSYSGHESGARGIRDVDVEKYARAFNVSPQHLGWGAQDHGYDGFGRQPSLAPEIAEEPPQPEPLDIRIPIMMSESDLDAIETWRHANRVGSRAEAIRFLVHEGLKAKPSAPPPRRRARPVG